MTILPDGLASWKDLLSLFDSAVATALAPMLGRLARAIGPMAADDADAGGDPSGYDGVATRGSYERLLPSEWLLADEVPDEFLRRAAAREHLFYQMAWQRPRGRRAATVLVDVGPEVLGTPRIGALAALLVLAHRSLVAGARFQWRPAQAGGECLTDVGASAIRVLLTARADFVCADGMLEGAIGQAKEAGEVWVVAGPEGSRAAKLLGASVVGVEDVIEPGVHELTVRVQGRGRPELGIRLPLPEESACVRVLRDPFPRSARPVRHRPAPAPLTVARPVLSTISSHVYAKLADGRVLVVTLPKSKRQDVGNGRKLSFNGPGEIVAAGHVRRTPAFVVQHDHDLTFVTWGGKKGTTRRLGRSGEPLRPPPVDGRLFPLVAGGDAVFFVSRGGRFLEFRPGNTARVLAECGAVVHARGAIFITQLDMATSLRTLSGPDRDLGPAWAFVDCLEGLLAPTMLGGLVVAFQIEPRWWAAVALDPSAVDRLEEAARNAPASSQASQRPPWLDNESLPPGSRLLRVEVPPSSEVVGVLDHLEAVPRTDSPNIRHTASSPALLLLEEDGRKLRVATGGRGPEFSIALPKRAVHVVVDPRTRVAVCVTDTAELLLVALAWRAVHARFTGGGRIA